MTEMILLGAGASVDADVPDAHKMTRCVIERFEQIPGLREQKWAVYFVMGGLQFQQGIAGNNPDDSVDIESLVNALIALSLPQRLSFPAKPFIQAWHPTVDFFDKRHNSLNRRFGYDIFESAAGYMKQMLTKIVWVRDSDKVRYLTPLLSLLESQGRLVIASLNYDNCVELMAHQNRVECDSLIEQWCDSGTVRLPEHGLTLLKLHGSADWEDTHHMDDEDSENQIPTTSTIRKVSNEVVTTAITAEQALTYDPAVIFGGTNKLTADGPFLDLLSLFNEELSRTSLLTVVGYSFRDDHINMCISRWLNQDLSRTLRVIKPTLSEQTSEYVGYLFARAHARICHVPLGAKEGLEKTYGRYADRD